MHQIPVQNIGIMKVVVNIKGNHIKQFKKENMEAIYGDTIYHIWSPRKWRRFKDKRVHTEAAVSLINKEIIERLCLLVQRKQ